MAFIVTDGCIRCKYMDCVSACPADCFREGENMLVIAPDECIDCGACWGACPARAIEADSERGCEKWIGHNRRFAALWPALTRKPARTPADADGYRGVKGKFERYFSPLPGRGD